MAMSAKEVAIELGTDARTLRKFLREVTPQEDQPGQGGRWLLEKKALKGLKKQFEEWRAGQAKPRAKRGKAEAPVEDDELEEVELDDEDEDEELDEDEPSEDELEDIEDEELEEDEDLEEI